jgi:5-oxopent-3-ene-1,2,5-tricarboxylate decarboxylase/2-hydroxyhepta-2,4-diene-1,7-dioate isomerase
MQLHFPPFRLTGTVYGTLLNYRPALAALGAAASQPPYKAPPQAPVLYVKPRNTLAPADAPVVVPGGVEELEVGASLGLILGQAACRLAAGNAADAVAGLLPVNDVCIPHDSFFRPSVRLRARDGFGPLGVATARAAAGDPDAMAVRVYVDERLVLQASTADMIRSVARLLVDVTEFMTLAAGDILTMGVATPAPRVRAGQVSRIEIGGLPPLVTRFVAAAS